MDRWAEWAKINVTFGFTVPIFWGVVRPTPLKQNPAAINVAVKKFDGLLDIAEAHLARSASLRGDDFSLPKSS